MPQSTPSPRGDETRNLLLDAGLRLFSKFGYDGVSTRQLARESGANIAAIAYHFGGKRELYRAVLHQIVEDTEPVFGPAIQAVKQGTRDANGDPKALAMVVKGFATNLIQVMLNEAFLCDRAPMIMREFAMPSEDFDILFEGRLRPVHEALTGLVAAVFKKPIDDPECVIQAHAIMGQTVVFELARVVLFRRLDWDGYNADRSAEVANVVARSITNSLGLPDPHFNNHEENSHGQR